MIENPRVDGSIPSPATMKNLSPAMVDAIAGLFRCDFSKSATKDKPKISASGLRIRRRYPASENAPNEWHREIDPNASSEPGRLPSGT